MFPDANVRIDRGISKTSVYKAFVKRIEDVGIPRLGRRLSPHTLRYSLATHLARAKMDIDNIRVVMRHASITTTQRYIEAVTQRSAEAAKRRVLARGAFVRRAANIEAAADMMEP